MNNAFIDSKGDLIVTATESSAATDFDFLMGDHHVHHKKLKTRLANNRDWLEFDGTHTMHGLLNGIGNLERHFMIATDGKPVEGMALRLFNPVTRLWSIHWADSRSGALDAPMTGSFENGVGYFFTKDVFEGKPILVQFKWDATDPAQSVWSQAFSADNGNTWEWNWYMYFTKNKTAAHDLSQPAIEKEHQVGVIELRNYIVKTGSRDAFIHYFEEHLILPQEELKGYPLGQYRVKGYEDNFFWIRGFESMQTRSAFLPSFYYGSVWKQHRNAANGMLVNNDNVHLLRPLAWQQDSLVPVATVSSSVLQPKNRIMVIDLYTSNSKRDQLMKVFAKDYLPLMEQCGIKDFSLWISETKENDFPQLPVFQDKNIFVCISFFENELDYSEKMKTAESKMSETLRAGLQDAVTLKYTLVLYPTDFTQNEGMKKGR